MRNKTMYSAPVTHKQMPVARPRLLVPPRPKLRNAMKIMKRP